MIVEGTDIWYLREVVLVELMHGFFLHLDWSSLREGLSCKQHFPERV